MAAAACLDNGGCLRNLAAQRAKAPIETAFIAGAVAGAASEAGALLAGARSLATALFGWALSNPDKAQQATASAIEFASGTPLPMGFVDVGAFSNFSSTLSSGLEAAGAEGSAFLTGSAVTGKSFATGAAFDVGRVSDFDVAVVSKNLLGQAKELGLALRSGGARIGPLSAQELKALGLSEVQQTLTNQAGRPVNFMIYESEEALKRRGNPYTPLQ